MSGSMLLTGGRLPGTSAPADLLVIDGVIAAFAESGTVAARAGVETIPLDGRILVPGLWDRHVHFTQWALVSRRLDLSAALSAADAAALVAERAAELPVAAATSEPIVGYGFRDGLWPDAPSRAVLDAASGAHPVVLVSADLHCCWLNSAALAEHGHGEHPTGLLVEDECFAVVRSLGEVEPSVLDGWVADAARVAAGRGVVGIVDLEMAWNREEWLRRISAGQRSLRVEFGVYPQHLDRAIVEGLRSGDLIPGTDGLLTVGPFKVITDGSLNTRTAYCFDEYPGLEARPGSHGLLTLPYEDLVPALHRAVSVGFQPAVHAIGDHANRLALDAFEEVGAHGTIEHAQLVAESDFARFAALGVTASVQPEHAMDDRDVADRYWSGRTDRAFALASLLRAGARLALGSDAPVAPLDPWVTIAAAVGRTRGGAPPWHSEQAISREDALAASTNGRTLAVGQPADVAVLELDPLSASVDELRTMPVAATLLAGRFTHRAL